LERNGGQVPRQGKKKKKVTKLNTNAGVVKRFVRAKPKGGENRSKGGYNKE